MNPITPSHDSLSYFHNTNNNLHCSFFTRVVTTELHGTINDIVNKLSSGPDVLTVKMIANMPDCASTLSKIIESLLIKV